MAPEVQDRYDGLAPTPAHRGRARRRLAGLTGRALDAVNLNALLAQHDQETAAAAPAGRRRRSTQRRSPGSTASDATIAQAKDGPRPPRRRPPTSRCSRAGSTATRPTTRRCATCTRSSSTPRERSPTKVRAAFDREQAARARLPGDTRALVVIMADIAQGGLNQAAISIEEARVRPRRCPGDPAPAPAGRRARAAGVALSGASSACLPTGPGCPVHSSQRQPSPCQVPTGRATSGRTLPCRSASSPASRGRRRQTSSWCRSSASRTSPAPSASSTGGRAASCAALHDVRRAPRQAVRDRAAAPAASSRSSASCPSPRATADELDRERSSQGRRHGRSGGSSGVTGTRSRSGSTRSPALDGDAPRPPSSSRAAWSRAASSPRRSTARTATPRRPRSTSCCSSRRAATPPRWRRPPSAAGSSARARTSRRRLANRAANDVTPQVLADEASALADGARPVDRRRRREARQGARHGDVPRRGAGERQPAADDRHALGRRRASKDELGRHLAIVGKGVCFDSGGISIKPADRMEEMKMDKTGACTVIAAIVTVARLAPGMPLMAVAPAVENMPGAACDPARRHRQGAQRQARRHHQHRRRGPPDPRRRDDLRRAARARPTSWTSRRSPAPWAGRSATS